MRTRGRTVNAHREVKDVSEKGLLLRDPDCEAFWRWRPWRLGRAAAGDAGGEREKDGRSAGNREGAKPFHVPPERPTYDVARLSKPVARAARRANPNVKDELPRTLGHRRWLLACNVPLMRGASDRDTCVRVRVGGVWDPVLPALLFCQPKNITLKKQSLSTLKPQNVLRIDGVVHFVSRPKEALGR